MDDVSASRRLGLKVGEWVSVRPAEEILATLDQRARFEELPFMPQMLKYCGKTFRVRKRAHKLCDTVNASGGRRMTDAVILDADRCDGEAYGGCEMQCAIIWKEAWLRRSDSNENGSPTLPAPDVEDLVRSGTRASQENPTIERRYTCQATQLPAATRPLPWWEPQQYVEDYRSGNVALSDVVARLVFLVYAKFAGAGIGFGSPLRWIYNRFQVSKGGTPYPICPGHIPIGSPTPTVNLGLKVGELVRVKNRDEILATVDEALVNRGMGFHPEMMPYCGKTFRVQQRLRRLMNEKTGQVLELKNSCLVLQGADCYGRYAPPLNCPRECPPYWREIWLERVDEGQVHQPAGAGDLEL